MLAYLLLASCGTLGRCSRNPGVPRNPGWKTLSYVVSRRALSFETIWVNLRPSSVRNEIPAKFICQSVIIIRYTQMTENMELMERQPETSGDSSPSVSNATSSAVTASLLEPCHYALDSGRLSESTAPQFPPPYYVRPSPPPYYAHMNGRWPYHHQQQVLLITYNYRVGEKSKL